METSGFLKSMFAGFVLAAMATAPAYTQDWSRVRQKVEGSVAFIEVTVEALDGTDRQVSTATGFVISNRGHAITAAHAVPRVSRDKRGFFRAALGGRQAHRFSFEVVMRDEDLDVALLKFPSSGFSWSPLEFGESELVPKDARLYVLGFPRTSDLVSAEGLLRGDDGPGGKWQTTLPLDYGHSGGPVFDIEGRVIGVAVGGFDDAKAQTFVVPAHYIYFMRRYASTAIENVPGMTAIAFGFSADHEERKPVSELFCIGSDQRIESVKPIIASRNGDDSRLLSTTPVPNQPNCVQLNALVAGKGVDKIGPIIVNHKGRGWLSGQLEIRTSN